jgi:putative endonuclease
MLTQRQRAGQRAEDLAAAFLSTRGWEILARNFRRRLGELDLVARRDGLLAIVEVRTRADVGYGSAAASVDRRKQRRIVRAAQQLLQQRRDLARLPVRFDVIVVSEPCGASPAIEWIPHAFET